ncbi:MAG: CDP-alcohol phosphatidyltransferase family protein [Candidatus Peribacteraceae bacterium]|nr:CDP-alcohol phosphatidyltransferase family protein [Candidatus Peribacteraceae bacterium]
MASEESVSPSATSVLRAWEHLPGMQRALRAVGKAVSSDTLSLLRIPVTAVAVALDAASCHASAAVTYGAAVLTDMGDGAVARATKTVSRKGMLLDTLCDKGGNITALVYHIAVQVHALVASSEALPAMERAAFAAGALASITCNIRSQLQRGTIREQAAILWEADTPEGAAVPSAGMIQANIYGKLKQIIECVAIGALFAAGREPVVAAGAGATLAVSAALTEMGRRRREANSGQRQEGAIH